MKGVSQACYICHFFHIIIGYGICHSFVFIFACLFLLCFGCIFSCLFVCQYQCKCLPIERLVSEKNKLIKKIDDLVAYMSSGRKTLLTYAYKKSIQKVVVYFSL